MKTNIFIASLMVTSIFFTGCGGSSSKLSSGNDDDSPAETIKKHAKAQLGVLANATVKIYELGSSPHKLLFTETTTSGKTVAAIGNFNAHENELAASKYYLYEVQGGNDWDIDDDGVLDITPTLNKGMFRSVVLGSDVKSIGGKFKITAVSEILYKKVEEHIDNIAQLKKELKEAPKAILKNDLNSDSIINEKDILLYNPVTHKNVLNTSYENILDKVIGDIHSNSPLNITVAPSIKGATFTLSIFHAIGSAIGQVPLIDDGNEEISFTLTGEGSSYFAIDNEGTITTTGSLADAQGTYDLIATVSNTSGSDSVAVVITVNDTSLDFSINENVPFSYIVPTSASSVSFELSGDDASHFNFNTTSKELSFGSKDFENPQDLDANNIYKAILEETDNAGSSTSHEITLQVKNVAENPPVIISSEFLLTSTAIGTQVGQVTIEDGDGNPIEPSFALSGPGSENFKIKAGLIWVINTLTEPVYELTVTAHNDAGEGQALIKISFASIDISVYENTNFHLIVPGNGTAISPALAGDDYEFFNYDTTTRILTFITPHDYENPQDANGDNIYNVIVLDTPNQEVNVKVTNTSEIAPTLSDTYTFNLTDTTIGAVIGNITPLSEGDSSVNAYTLSGSGSENFSISKVGGLIVSGMLTEVSYSFNVTASNMAGESNTATINIDL